MAKVVDITNKLNFEKKPILVIKGQHIKVNNDAETMLKIMGTFSNSSETDAAIACLDYLFEEKERQKLNSLHLNFKDLMTVIGAAMELIKGDDEEDGGES